ncbi:MAG: Two component regulator three Y domain protein [Gilvibacter sp.]
MKKLLILFAFFATTTSLFAEISTTQKNALVDFYYATNGDSWNTSWDLTSDVANWHGVTIQDSQVIGISLLFNNLTGTLPASLSDLTSLKTLELSFNNIEGFLPESLGNLSQLEILAINGNSLNGSLPTSLGQLSQLKQMHLSSNKLEGGIPTQFESLQALEILNLFDNNLSGKVPACLAKCSNLKQVLLAENDLQTDVEFSIIVLSAGSELDLRPKNTKAAPILANRN